VKVIIIIILLLLLLLLLLLDTPQFIIISANSNNEPMNRGVYKTDTVELLNSWSPERLLPALTSDL